VQQLSVASIHVQEENESEGFPTETVEEVNALLRAYEESEA
jgi:hypothetical protein